jgi:eukaryotic translation initiation factor 2C
VLTFWLQDDDVKHQFARRPAFNASGKPIKVEVNQYRVKEIGHVDVYQYSVSITPVPARPIMIEKIWNTATCQAKLKEQTKKTWIFDRRAIAWCPANLRELRVRVNIDEAKGYEPKEENMFNVVIKPAGTIRLAMLRAYLNGETDFANPILECMNFLDHVIRETPAKQMQAIKRLFFPANSRRGDLSNCIEVIQGMYASIRMNQSIKEGGSGLGINVNIANCAFWLSQNFEQLAREYLRLYGERAWANLDYGRMAEVLKPIEKVLPNGTRRYELSPAFKVLIKLYRIKFVVSHRGKENDRENKVYTLKRFAHHPEFGAEGGNAKQYSFDMKQRNGQTRKVSVFEYFQMRYNITLQYWRLPLLETSRGGAFPMEVCRVPRYNRYPFKLSPLETSKMIKFAVQRPPVRRADIQNKADALQWHKDPVLQEFGIKMDTQMAAVNARLIQNPEIEFGDKKKHNPGTSGRWDLRGKKFVKPNPFPLKSWAFVSVEQCIDKPGLDRFAKAFCAAYRGHGGKIEKEPLLLSFKEHIQHDVIITEAMQQTGKANKASPQIIFLVLKDRTAWIYERLKKNADCRWALLTQMVLLEHVVRAQPQYCSNVAMKVNAKLGGSTSRLAGPSPFKVPTMFIGVDVSHGAAGAKASTSMAAICCSIDKDASYFVGDAEANGKRVEVLMPQNVRQLIPPMIKAFQQANKCFPKQVFYFRDGVSEGQFGHVMEYEIKALKQAFQQETGGVIPKITVIVATKRHHIRFFPDKSCADKNGNALPGTLVDREVTHPFQYDFYLCAHVALQGTARPVHYHVISDEIGMKPDDLQKMIYQQCYQYMRATTPVSLHPAVYYAHLAGARARQHENVATSDQVPAVAKDWVQGHVPGWGAKTQYQTNTSREDPTECIPLLKMGGDESRSDMRHLFRTGMWYI